MSVAQPQPFSKNGKWGMQTGDLVTVAATYDTIYDFDPTGRVCVACNTVRKVTTNALIRVTSVSSACHYLNTKGKKLVIKNADNDTCSIFLFGRHSLSQYNNTSNVMTVNANGKKHLVDKNFRQLTFEGYHHVENIAGAPFYLCQQKNSGDKILSGLVDLHENIVIPFYYSSIQVNTSDSLITGCRAGLKGPDEVFKYNGEKIADTHRHIAHAGKQFFIHETFDASGGFYLLDRKNGTETALDAEEIRVTENGRLMLRKKKRWYEYNMVTGEKNPVKQ